MAGVLVRKRGIKGRYLCHPPLGRRGWKCGFCLRGNITPLLKEKCKVCGARVCEIS
jgi:hypothetical protein